MKRFICILIFGLMSVPVIAGQDAMFYQHLDWSPNGKNLSFTAMSDYDEKTDHYRTDIFTIKTNGMKLQKISGDAKHAFASAWSAGGRRIFFSAETEDGKDSNIFSLTVKGANLIQLTKNARDNTAPSVSPDGTKIAFMATRDGEKYQIYVMDADGNNVKKLTSDPAVAFCNPVWSKDGKRLVYYTDKGDRHDQIWIMDADGTNQTWLTGGTGHNIFPSFTPDGKRIIFSRRDDRDADQSYTDASFLFVMNIDGSKLRPLAKLNSFFARFSPDGKRSPSSPGNFPPTRSIWPPPTARISKS